MILIQQINLLKKNLNKYMINESLKYVFLIVKFDNFKASSRFLYIITPVEEDEKMINGYDLIME